MVRIMITYDGIKVEKRMVRPDFFKLALEAIAKNLPGVIQSAPTDDDLWEHITEELSLKGQQVYRAVKLP